MDTEEMKQAVVAHIRDIALANATDFLQVQDGTLCVRDTATLTPQLGAAIASIERTSTGLKLKLYDKLKALELLGKLLGLFDAPPMEHRENELLQAILQSTGEVLDTNDLPEIQQAADDRYDLVEPAGSEDP